MRPRVLVLDVQRVGQPIETVTTRIIEAVAEGSRYHGYSDSAAPAFLQYEIEKIVDLRDPSAEYPSFCPPGPNFDAGELFTDAFAERYGFEDPDQPGEHLGMCELFERGMGDGACVTGPAAGTGCMARGVRCKHDQSADAPCE